MKVVVEELDTGIIKLAHTNISIEIKKDQVTILDYNVPIVSAKMPELKAGDLLVYANAWFDCVAIVPGYNGTTADIKPILSMPHWLREFDLKMWDVKNCIGCGAYSEKFAVEYWANLYRDYVTPEIVGMILKGVIS